MTCNNRRGGTLRDAHETVSGEFSKKFAAAAIFPPFASYGNSPRGREAVW